MTSLDLVLPDELYYEIVKFLDVKGMLTMCSVNKLFNKLFSGAKHQRNRLLVTTHRGIMRLRSMETMIPALEGLMCDHVLKFLPWSIKSEPFSWFIEKAIFEAAHIVKMRNMRTMYTDKTVSMHMYMPHHFRFTFCDSTYFYPDHADQMSSELYDAMMTTIKMRVHLAVSKYLIKNPQYVVFDPLIKPVFRFRGAYQGTMLILLFNQKWLRRVGGFTQTIEHTYCDQCATTMHTCVNQLPGFCAKEYYACYSKLNPREVKYEVTCAQLTLNSTYDSNTLRPIVEYQNMNSIHSKSGTKIVHATKQTKANEFFHGVFQDLLDDSALTQHPCVASDFIGHFLQNEIELESEFEQVDNIMRTI